MHDTTDHELLRRYADQGVEEAFTELVKRHCNLVWAAARRVSGDGDAARDVAQTVFTDLARKAGQLPAGTVLAGWLYRAACHTATKHVRGESRRILREQQAMQHEEPPPATGSAAEARSAAELQPLLDAAMAELTEADRDAVVLRFLAGRSLAEVGATLGTNEDAAQKRVSRALEKLREVFRRRGVTVSGGTLAVALVAAGTQTAPTSLAATVATGALAGTGATASWIFLMKSKLILGVAGGAVVAAALVQQQRNVSRLTEDNSALRQQIAALAAPPVAAATDGTDELERLRGEHAELLRLRGEVARLRQNSTPELAKRPRTGGAGPAAEEAAIAQKSEMDAAHHQTTRIVNALKNIGLAARIYSVDHEDRLPTTFEEMRNEMGLAADGTLPGGISPDLFEFFPHERIIGDSEPQLIWFREKSPRQLPDGTWQCVYCLGDGSVQTITSPTGDFSEFERGRKGTPANAPKQP